MRTHFSSDRISRLGQNNWHVFRNDSGETIPPFSVLRVDGTAFAHGKTLISAKKPDGSSDKFYMVSGPTSVEDGRYGQCTWGNPVLVAYDTSDTAPAVGSEWGAKSGQWTLDEDGSNFWIIGTVTHSSLTLVEAIQDHRGETTYLGRMINSGPQTVSDGDRDEVEFNTSRISQNITVTVANNDFTIVTGGHYMFYCELIVEPFTAGGADWDTTAAATLESSISAGGTKHDRFARCTLGARSSNHEQKQLQIMDAASLVTDDVVHWYLKAEGDDVIIDEASAVIWRIGP